MRPDQCAPLTARGALPSPALKPASYLIRYSPATRFRASIPNLGHYVSCVKHDCSLSKNSQNNGDSKRVGSFQIGKAGTVRPDPGLVPRRLAAGLISENKIQEDCQNEDAGLLG